MYFALIQLAAFFCCFPMKLNKKHPTAQKICAYLLRMVHLSVQPVDVHVVCVGLMSRGGDIPYL